MRHDDEKLWVGYAKIQYLLILLEDMGISHLKSAAALFSGFRSIEEAPRLAPYAQAVRNLRLLGLRYSSQSSLLRTANLYVHKHQGQDPSAVYEIDTTDYSFRRVPGLMSPLFSRAKAVLSKPLPSPKHGMAFADEAARSWSFTAATPQKDIVRLNPVQVPLPIPLSGGLRMKLPKIAISLSDLYDIADDMDRIEAARSDRRPGNWVKRLRSIQFCSARTADLAEIDALNIFGTQHLIGVPGGGKTTLLVLISAWCARNDVKALLLFAKVDTCLSYQETLAYHGVNCAILSGSSQDARQRHADRISEAIVAGHDRGGFGVTSYGAQFFQMSCPLGRFVSDESDLDVAVEAWGRAPCESLMESGKRGYRLCPAFRSCL